MADVTVKQLAQVVGIPIDRLLTQLQEAGLSIKDELQTVNEDQKRILLNHLKGSTSVGSGAAERITLRRKSVSQVSGHDANRGKTVNIEVRKQRVYVKAPVEPVPEPVLELEEQIIELPEEAVLPEVIAVESEVKNADNSEQLTSEKLNPEPVIIPSEPVIVDRSVKKKAQPSSEEENKSSAFKRNKKKSKHSGSTRDESEFDSSSQARRNKAKKRKGNEKSENKFRI